MESKQKAELAYFIEKEEFLKAQVVLEEEENVQEQLPPEVEEAMLRSLQEKLLSYCTSNPKIGKELKKQAEGLNKLKSFIQVVAVHCLLVMKNVRNFWKQIRLLHSMRS